jgi:hypothetical protein
MDCKEFERKIPDFIERRLDYFELKKFSRHLEECDNCREELVIQFLVSEGIQRLEEGDAFDLQKELDIRLDEAGRSLKRQDGAIKFGFILEILCAAAVIGFVVWILI